MSKGKAADKTPGARKLVGRKQFADYLGLSVDTLERRASLVDPREFGVQVNGQWEGWEDQARAWDEVACAEARRPPEARRERPRLPRRPPEPPGVAGIVGRSAPE